MMFYGTDLFRDNRKDSTQAKLAPELAIWVSVVQWFECLTDHQKVVGLIPIWGLKITFPEFELDDRPTIINVAVRRHRHLQDSDYRTSENPEILHFSEQIQTITTVNY